jgi:hypothetical protein
LLVRNGISPGFVGLALAIAAACGGGTDDRPEAPADVVSCAGIDELESYRYSITVQLRSPAFETVPSGTPPGNGGPLSAFAETLAALLSDFRIQGAHVAPDRTQAVLQFQQEEVELRAIGERRWERLGDVWREEEGLSEEIGFLTPVLICEDVLQEIGPELEQREGVSELLNGVKSDRYTLDRTDLAQLPDVLGTGPEAQLPDQFRVDVWLASDGGWPVRLDISSEDTDDRGNPISVRLAMELRDIDDRGISIEPPAAGDPSG